MSTKYDKILIRSSLQDDGTLPRTGDVSDSPDTIPYGTTLVTNPVVFFIGNYDQNVGTDLQAAQENYIYVRGKSLVNGIVQSDLYLYYALDSELDQPAKWSNNILKTESGASFARVLSQSKGNIVVSSEAFVWVPPTPAKTQSYSLIGIAVAAGTKPDFRGITDFEDFVDNNNNVGWNKVTIKTNIPPVPPLYWETSFQYVQGVAQPQMNFEILCNGIPTTSYIGFSATTTSGTNPIPPIFLDARPVENPNGSYGIQASVAADYKGIITFSLYGQEFPDNSSLTFRAYYVESQTKGGPQKPIILAQVTTTNKAVKARAKARQRQLAAEEQ